MKKAFIQKQKEKIQELRESSGSENLRENAIKKLNLMQDDLETNGDEITKENIHLYYQFMTDDVIREICVQNVFQNDAYNELYCGVKLISYRYDLFFNRLSQIKNKITIPNYYSELKIARLGNIKDSPLVRIGLTVFGIKDTLEPIDEYIAEIKESEQYKKFTFKCRCNNCMTYFESDDDLLDAEDEDGEFKACPECNTDAYLMDLTNLK